MKKTLLPLLSCFLLSFGMLPVIKAGNNNASAVAASVSPAVNDSAAEAATTTTSLEAKANELFSSMELASIGLSFDALHYALKGYETLRANGAIQNEDVLTVIDFSQPSSKKRMYILDLNEKKVLFNTYVAHGKNSGLQYAEKFSNKMESLQSSLGFYVTKGTYFGKHGLSLRLSGQEPGFNSNAEDRAVVVHGAEYIGSNRADAAFMGRSFGCPAVPQAQSAKVINMIKDGTTIFIYHPSANNYVKNSKLLNS
jgi:hypothetical protein